MKLVFQGETIVVDESLSVQQIIETIDNILTDQYFFSHLLIEEQEVYDDLEEYLYEVVGTDITIEIVAKTVQQFINEVLVMTTDYLERAIPEMPMLASHFYKSPNASDWQTFSDMIEGMQWLYQSIETIDQLKQKPTNWNDCIYQAAQLQVELQTLQEAVENTDSVLIADIVQYELLPIYQKLDSIFNTIIDNEVQRYDVN